MLPGSAKIYSGSGTLDVSELTEGSSVTSGIGRSELSVSDIDAVHVSESEEKPLFKFVTQGGAELICSPEQTLFARIDLGMKCFSVYLQERSSLGFRIGVSFDLVKELSAPGACKKELAASNELEITDRFWILENTDNLSEAHFIQKLTSYRYSIPDIPFLPRVTDHYSLGASYTKMIFDNIDTPKGATEVLKASYMFEEHPHITLRLSSNSSPVSSSIQFNIFGGDRKGSSGCYSHSIKIFGNKIKDPKCTLRERRLHGNWRLSIIRDDFEEAELFVKTLANLDNLEIIKKIQFTEKDPYYLMPASHVKRGMTVPILDGDGKISEDIVKSVDVAPYNGKLYQPEASKFKNIIVNGWFIGA